jgi:chromosome segregation ATPase
MVKLNQRQLELENKCKEFQGRYRTLVQERRVAEGEEKELRAILQGLENRLGSLRVELSEQEERNRELQGRLFDP